MVVIRFVNVYLLLATFLNPTINLATIIVLSYFALSIMIMKWFGVPLSLSVESFLANLEPYFTCLQLCLCKSLPTRASKDVKTLSLEIINHMRDSYEETHMIKNIKNSFNEIWGEGTLRGGGDFCPHLYCFSRVPYLNFNHVNIMINFHNAFVYYDRSPSPQTQKNYI